MAWRGATPLGLRKAAGSQPPLFFTQRTFIQGIAITGLKG
jgi:hypothetical protein